MVYVLSNEEFIVLKTILGCENVSENEEQESIDSDTVNQLFKFMMMIKSFKSSKGDNYELFNYEEIVIIENEKNKSHLRIPTVIPSQFTITGIMVRSSSVF